MCNASLGEAIESPYTGEQCVLYFCSSDHTAFIELVTESDLCSLFFIQLGTSALIQEKIPMVAIRPTWSRAVDTRTVALVPHISGWYTGWQWWIQTLPVPA